jgi:16S rRNA (guanine527-N7)-methyltransferase
MCDGAILPLIAPSHIRFMRNQEEQIERYFSLLRKWNRRMNLMAASDEEDFHRKHVGDARVLLHYLGDAKTLIDLGTGAGLPGILIKIARPDIEVTLLDATRKKVSFCEEAIRTLGLEGIRAAWGRAEDPKLVGSLGTFDVAVSRATWKLAQFLEIARPYLSKGSRCIAMKGAKWREEEVGARETAEGNSLKLEGTHEYRLEGQEQRCIMIYRLSS